MSSPIRYVYRLQQKVLDRVLPVIRGGRGKCPASGKLLAASPTGLGEERPRIWGGRRYRGRGCRRHSQRRPEVGRICPGQPHLPPPMRLRWRRGRARHHFIFRHARFT